MNERLEMRVVRSFYVSKKCFIDQNVYTGCFRNRGTAGYGVILYLKISRKKRMKFFSMTLCFRENRV